MERAIENLHPRGCNATNPLPRRFKEWMCGLFNSAGWGAYYRKGSVFIKPEEMISAGHYCDFGCNFQAFTNPEFIKLETLGPLVELHGQTVEHTEH